MKSLIIAGLLLTSTAAFSQTAEQIRKDGLRACLAEAQTEYKREYYSHCPGGHNFPCTLPYVLSSEVRSDFWQAQSQCYSANSAGLFTPEPIDMRPKTDKADNNSPAAVENGPPRNFRISPQ